MKLTRKQKEFKRLHKYTIVNMNNVTVKLKNDGTCVPALADEIGTFIMFTPKTFIGEIKKDFVSIGEIIRLKHELFRRWQVMVLADSKSKIHNGRKYWVLDDLNGDYHSVNRDEILGLQRKGLLEKNKNFMYYDKNAIYIAQKKQKKR